MPVGLASRAELAGPMVIPLLLQRAKVTVMAAQLEQTKQDSGYMLCGSCCVCGGIAGIGVWVILKISVSANDAIDANEEGWRPYAERTLLGLWRYRWYRILGHIEELHWRNYYKQCRTVAICCADLVGGLWWYTRVLDDNQSRNSSG